MSAVLTHDPRPLTPGQKVTLAIARERSESRHIPKTARSHSAPPTRPGQYSVVLSPSSLRVRTEASKSSARCGKLKPGSHVEVVAVEGTRAEIKLPGKGTTGWITTEKDGQVLLGRDFDWEGHIDRVKPAWESNEEMARVLEQLDPTRASTSPRNNIVALRIGDSRRKRDEWARRHMDETVKHLNTLSIKLFEPEVARHEAERLEREANLGLIHQSDSSTPGTTEFSSALSALDCAAPPSLKELRDRLASGHLLTAGEMARLEEVPSVEDLRDKLASGHMLTADEMAQLEAAEEDAS